MIRTKERRRTAVAHSDDIGSMAGMRRSRPPAAGPVVTLRSENETRRTGDDWTVPEQVVAEAISGKLIIDFTRARCSRREIDVRVRAASGTVVLIVPRGWRVDLDGMESGGGALTNRVTLPRFPGAPLVRVAGRTGTGAVKARYPYRSPLNRLRRTR